MLQFLRFSRRFWLGDLDPEQPVWAISLLCAHKSMALLLPFRPHLVLDRRIYQSLSRFVAATGIASLLLLDLGYSSLTCLSDSKIDRVKHDERCRSEVPQ